MRLTDRVIILLASLTFLLSCQMPVRNSVDTSTTNVDPSPSETPLLAVAVPSPSQSISEALVPPSPGSQKADVYLNAVTVTMDQRVLRALSQIDGTGRKLLALRAYLQRESVIDSRWAWTREEVEQFEGSQEHKRMLAEIERVRFEFAEMNPGYTLRVNTNVRSLEEQLTSWNTTVSVGRASEAMLSAAQRELSGASYPNVPDERSVRNFARFTRSFVPRPQPTVAAPGLSPHGRLRAFDFVIEKNGQVIAGTRSADARSIWDDTGWTKKLNQAVLRASNRLSGPLMNPYEPWHYTYQ